MIQCRRINKKGFVMQKKSFSILLTAALLAFPLLADDGAYVVIERTYYEQCKNDFETHCQYLYDQIAALFRSWGDELTLINNQNAGYSHTISLAILQIDQAREDLDLTDPAQIEADTHLQGSRNTLIALGDNIDRNSTLISSWSHALTDAKIDLQNHVIATSNSFPYVVASTNLNIYIIVTNSFEAATNNYCSCTNEFEHFLNYYSDARNEILDQYRATVTNLLNESVLRSQLTYTFWHSMAGATSSQQYLNINWGDIMMNPGFGSVPLTSDILYGSSFFLTNPWNKYLYDLPIDSYNLQSALMFNIMGVHDDMNVIAVDLVKTYIQFAAASTSTVFTVLSPSVETNAMVQFLTAPETYGEQVSKISQTRNWFQRLEHWLSSIARNTAPLELGDESDQDSEQDIANVIEMATNEISVASIGIKDSFINTLPDLTNTTVALQGAVTSVSRILDSFKSSGGNRSSSSAPSSFNLMKTEFINTTFTRLGIEETQDMPYYIGADQDTEGFEDVQTAATWIHHIFGFIWLCSGIALLVFYARWLSSWVVTIWYRMLGMLVKVSKFTWGSS